MSRNGHAAQAAPLAAANERLAGEILQLDELIERHSLETLTRARMGHAERAFMLAEGVIALRAAITPLMMRHLMQLQNTRLGFRTDRLPDPYKSDPGGYPESVVKECAIEALLRGAYLVGNEFNIIAGGCYLTKEFFARAVAEFVDADGRRLTDLKLSPGVPVWKQNAGGAVVPYSATWLLGGAAMRLDRDIPIRVNNGQGADAILGKATRKMLAAVLGRLTGSEHTIPEGEVDIIDAEAIPVSSTPAPSIDDLPGPARCDPAAKSAAPTAPPAAATDEGAPFAAPQAPPPGGSIADALRRAKERSGRPAPTS